MTSRRCAVCCRHIAVTSLLLWRHDGHRYVTTGYLDHPGLKSGGGAGRRVRPVAVRPRAGLKRDPCCFWDPDAWGTDSRSFVYWSPCSANSPDGYFLESLAEGNHCFFVCFFHFHESSLSVNKSLGCDSLLFYNVIISVYTFFYFFSYSGYHRCLPPSKDFGKNIERVGKTASRKRTSMQLSIKVISTPTTQPPQTTGEIQE